MKKRICRSILALFLLCQCSLYAQFTVLHQFEGGDNGALPFSNLFFDGTSFYGTTVWGGLNSDGILFKINPDGTDFQKLYDFEGVASGRMPYSTVISDGVFLYGMTYYGGTNDIGIVYRIKPDGTDFEKLLDFNGIKGSQPWGALVTDGTFLYGMTNYGGNGFGVIFKMRKDGTDYAKLLDFSETTTGSYPYGEFIFDGTYLYGTTAAGGILLDGTVFKIKPDGTGYAQIKSFSGTAPSGNYPYGSLVSDGEFLYGTTGTGGTIGNGTLFRLKPDGSEFQTLYNFGGINGVQPMENLTVLGDYLYGTAMYGGANDDGAIFRIGKNGTGYTRLFDFSCDVSSCHPRRSLIAVGTSLYGTIPYGNNGLIFKLDPEGLDANEFLPNDCEISVYPNPSEGVFSIQMCEQDPHSVEVYNVIGEKICRQALVSQHSDVNLSQFSNGIYFVKIIDGEQKSTTKKLILSR